ncbi:hypothetical protein Pelo_9950 [Pelomyxa schiedti]|nr:hypothetical protein Pelo_9950 [Pelomyxa schiedti]
MPTPQTRLVLAETTGSVVLTSMVLDAEPRTSWLRSAFLYFSYLTLLLFWTTPDCCLLWTLGALLEEHNSFIIAFFHCSVCFLSLLSETLRLSFG